MGMADFYIKINFNENKVQDIHGMFQKLVTNNLYSTIIETNNELPIICIEAKFDNMLPTLILIFENLYEYKSDKITIETYGMKEKFDFENVEDFIYFVLKANKNKLNAYYEELGYFSLNSKNYYKTRNKLKKYYTKIKK